MAGYSKESKRQNDALKQIKVIRPDAIQEVVGSYLEALKS